MNTHDEFRSVIHEERENLTGLCDFWNNQVKSDKSYSKEVEGRIRAAVGKTRLLLAEKFKQFEGLVEQSANNSAEKEISINDLQGFWDLVLIQVNEVKEMFQNITSPEGAPEGGRLGKPRRSGSERRDSSRPRSGKNRKSSADRIQEVEKKLQDVLEHGKGTSEVADLTKTSLSNL